MNEQARPAPTRVMKRSRELKAWELRRRGLSVAEIAEALGVGDHTVANYIKAGLKKSKELVSAEANDYRLLSLARLDRLFAHYWPIALGDAGPASLAAAEYCRKIEHDRADMMGLFAVKTPLGGNVFNITQSFSGMPLDELVALAQARGVPVPPALLMGTDRREEGLAAGSAGGATCLDSEAEDTEAQAQGRATETEGARVGPAWDPDLEARVLSAERRPGPPHVRPGPVAMLAQLRIQNRQDPE